MLRVLLDDDARADLGLDEIVREGARRMLAMALEAEVAGVITTFSLVSAGTHRDAGRVALVAVHHVRDHRLGERAGSGVWANAGRPGCCLSTMALPSI